VIILNFNEILNNVIAGIICSASISFFAFTFSFLKKNYNKNKSLFVLRFQFYLGLFGTLCSCYSLFKTNILPKWLLILCLCINIFGMFLYFENAIKYSDNRTK